MRHVDEIGQAARLHLAHHLATVCFHRELRDPEVSGDVLVELAANHVPHDLPFALTQQLVFPMQGSPFRLPSLHG